MIFIWSILVIKLIIIFVNDSIAYYGRSSNGLILILAYKILFDYLLDILINLLWVLIIFLLIAFQFKFISLITRTTFYQNLF